MPLIAELDGQRVDASKMSAADWAALQASEDRKRLVMPVCGMRAIAKKRGTGTQFFAHFVADCGFNHGDESPQHLAMKAAVAERIDAVPGWRSEKEFPHPSREWIIDVLAESDDGRRRVAFEVQLSGQTPEAYAARSQRYLNDGVFPVWLIPRHLEWNPVRVPTVVTGYGKSNAVPAGLSELMALPASQDFIPQAETLGELIDVLLTNGAEWTWGSPDQQKQKWELEESQAERARVAATEKQKELDRAIEDTNKRCTAPEKAFGEHTVRIDGGPYIWATLMECWSCGFPSVVWDATTPRPGQRHHLGTVPEVKKEAGLKRFENHPDVHRLVDRWMREVESDVMKAEIDLRKSKAKGSMYSAFTCPVCGTLSGQFFISQVRPFLWSLICAPVRVGEELPKKAAQQTKPSRAKSRRGEANSPKSAPAVAPQPEPALAQDNDVAQGYTRPGVRKQTWEELHSPEGIRVARRKFYGTNKY